MSLESASFIKALVATNPEGTDQKSQGDDHLRMIKSVLQQQFAGFQEGIPISVSETHVNRMCGSAGSSGHIAGNIDLIVPFSYIGGVDGTTIGTFPVAKTVGDLVLSLNYNLAVVYQLYFSQNGVVYSRYSAPTLQPWVRLSNPVAPAGQSWQAVSRSLNTVYVNSTSQTITVSACVTGTSGGAFVDAVVGALNVARTQIDTRFFTLQWQVPAGANYTLSSGTATLNFWNELR